MRKPSVSSSATIYGNPHYLPYEDHPKFPENPYGETKLLLKRLSSWSKCSKNRKVISLSISTL